MSTPNMTGAACKHCPSVVDAVPDEEAAFLLESGHAKPFYCAWRPEVWCVGWDARLREYGLPNSADTLVTT